MPQSNLTRRQRRRATIGLTGLGLALSSVGRAAPPEPGHHVDLTVGTDFPVMIGAAVTYESPQRIRAKLSGGTMPGPYVDTINWGMTTFDVYSDEVGTLIDVVLQNSAVMRVEAGWRPLAKRGLTLGLGYQYIALSGDTTDVDTLTSNMEGGMADGIEGLDGDLEVVAAPHMMTGELGYEWTIREKFVVRSTLGFAGTLSAKTTVAPTTTPDGQVRQQMMDSLVVISEDYLTYVFEEWVHVPMIGLYVGYRFK